MSLDTTRIRGELDSFLDKKFSRLDIKQKAAIAVVIMALPCAAFFFLAYSPKNEEIKNLETQKSGVEAEIQKVEKTASQIEKHRAEMAEVRKQFAEASLLLPDQKEIPALLATISGQAGAAGLEVISFRPAAEKPQQLYAEIPVDIAVQGSYHNVGAFLDKISKLSRIVAVNNIQMGSPKQMSGEMLLNSNFQLVTYRFLEGPEDGGKAATDAKAKK